MSALAETSDELAQGDRLARRNAVVLAVAQALSGGNNVLMIATGSIVGAMLAPDRGLATLPISIYVLGMWMGTLPIGALARRFGRRAAFEIGTVFGVLTGVVCCLAVLNAHRSCCSARARCWAASMRRLTRPTRFAAADVARAKRSSRRRSPG